MNKHAVSWLSDLDARHIGLHDTGWCVDEFALSAENDSNIWWWSSRKTAMFIDNSKQIKPEFKSFLERHAIKSDHKLKKADSELMFATVLISFRQRVYWTLELDDKIVEQILKKAQSETKALLANYNKLDSSELRQCKVDWEMVNNLHQLVIVRLEKCLLDEEIEFFLRDNSLDTNINFDQDLSKVIDDIKNVLYSFASIKFSNTDKHELDSYIDSELRPLENTIRIVQSMPHWIIDLPSRIFTVIKKMWKKNSFKKSEQDDVLKIPSKLDSSFQLYKKFLSDCLQSWWKIYKRLSREQWGNKMIFNQEPEFYSLNEINEQMYISHFITNYKNESKLPFLTRIILFKNKWFFVWKTIEYPVRTNGSWVASWNFARVMWFTTFGHMLTLQENWKYRIIRWIEEIENCNIVLERIALDDELEPACCIDPKESFPSKTQIMAMDMYELGQGVDIFNEWIEKWEKKYLSLYELGKFISVERSKLLSWDINESDYLHTVNTAMDSFKQYCQALLAHVYLEEIERKEICIGLSHWPFFRSRLFTAQEWPEQFYEYRARNNNFKLNLASLPGLLSLIAFCFSQSWWRKFDNSWLISFRSQGERLNIAKDAIFSLTWNHVAKGDTVSRQIWYRNILLSNNLIFLTANFTKLPLHLMHKRSEKIEFLKVLKLMISCKKNSKWQWSTICNKVIVTNEQIKKDLLFICASLWICPYWKWDKINFWWHYNIKILLDLWIIQWGLIEDYLDDCKSDNKFNQLEIAKQCYEIQYIKKLDPQDLRILLKSKHGLDITEKELLRIIKWKLYARYFETQDYIKSYSLSIRSQVAVFLRSSNSSFKLLYDFVWKSEKSKAWFKRNENELKVLLWELSDQNIWICQPSKIDSVISLRNRIRAIYKKYWESLPVSTLEVDDFFQMTTA